MSDSDGKLKTVKPDPRFQRTNATNWCFVSFVDYHRCLALLGPKNPGCKQLKEIYSSLCPNSWISRWEEQLQLGTFPLDITKPCPKPKKK